MTALGSLDEFGVLLLEDLEVSLGLPVPDAIGSKYQVHLLKGTLIGLGIQRPDHGDRDGVCRGEDVVCVFLYSLEHDGAEQSEPSVSDRPPDHTPGITLGTDFQGEDLSRVQPWDSEPGGAEGGGEQEDHSNRTGAVGLGLGGAERMGLTGSGETSSESHGYSLNDRAPVQSPAATDAVQGEDANEGGQLSTRSAICSPTTWKVSLPCR